MTIRTKLINRRYRLERRITLSETTETWLGFDNVLHRAVAVTVPRQEMLRDAPFLAEFLQRSRIATALHHRGIVAAFDSGEDGDAPYLITEYAGGEQLTDIIRAEAPFDCDDVAILVEQVASALDYAHQSGFVHGALAPSDVIVDGQGVTKLVGLGIPTGSIPWRIEPGSREPLTFDDDVQALAAIAFEMLTGERPETVEPGVAKLAYVIAPDVPRNASDIVSIGLGAGSVRFSSAGAFARALSDWRAFDPRAFYVAPESFSEPVDERQLPQPFTTPSTPSVAMEDWLGDEPQHEPGDEVSASRSDRGVRMALVAVLLLAVLAGVVIWRGGDVTAGSSTTLPTQIETLAELTGF